MIREPVKTEAQVEAQLATFADAPAHKESKRDAPKDFVIERIPGGGLLRIAYTAGGEVPDQLKGQFTQLRYAEAAIQDYKNRQLKEQVVG